MRWFLLLLITASAVWAQFPLPVPTRPTSFPLVRPPTSGLVRAWGNNDVGQTNVPVGLASVCQLGASDHSLALLANGSVVAWGWNAFGQASVPTNLPSIARVVAGGGHSVALSTEGRVYAWGINTYGQTNVPSSLTNIVDISAPSGGNYALALRSDGKVSGWGENQYGAASPPTTLSNVVAISAGSYHGLALRNDGSIVAWGYNGWGQTNVPSGLADVVQIASGGGHSLALRKDGTVVAWGLNNAGQASVPSGLSNIVQISASTMSSFALKSDGSIVSWGDDASSLVSSSSALSSVLLVQGGNAHALALIAAPAAPRVALSTANGDALSNGAAASSEATLLGQVSVAKVYTIANSGDGLLNNIVVTCAGSDSSRFLITGPVTNSLVSGASTTFSVSFTPFSSGPHAAQLSISSNDTTNSPFIINLSGFGIGEDRDTDGDGLNDAAELSMSELGFNWQSNQPTLVNALYRNANRAQLFTQSQYNANRTNGQADVTTTPAAFNLFTQSQYDSNRTAGRQDVIASPMAYGLYDSNSIMDLRMGGLMVPKAGGVATVTFQPQTTTDLKTQPFTNNGAPITFDLPMPADKGFMRWKAE